MHAPPLDPRNAAVLLAITLSTPAAAETWPEDGAPIAVFPCAQSATVAVPDGMGGAYVVWTDDRGCSRNEVYVLRLSGFGPQAPGWPASGMPVCTNTAGRSGGVAVADGTGGVIVAWRDSRPGSAHLYAERLAADGTRLWDPEGVAVCDAPGDQGSLSVLPDGQGGAFFAWMDTRQGLDDGPPHHHPLYDLYAQHIGPEGVISWAASGVPIVTLATVEFSPVLLTDGTGGALLTWPDNRGSAYLQRLNLAGETLLSENGVAIQGRFFGSMVSDGAGGIISTFMYGADTQEDLYAQRIDGAGNILWPMNGVLVEQAPYGQRPSDIVEDGEGGAYIASYDLRNGNNWDVYLQRITSSGARAPGWPVTEVPVCTVAGFQIYPRLVRAESGGCIVTWPDAREAGQPYDIYAQRITAQGTVAAGWPTDGVRLCHAVGDQISPLPVSDGFGGAFVAWTDYRVYADVYAQHVDGFGRVGTPVGVGVGPSVKTALAIGRIVPNPVRSGETLNLSLRVPENAPASLSLLDVRGRIVAETKVPPGNSGAVEVRWDLAREPEPGIYWVRMVQSGRSAVARLVVLR